MVHLAVAAVAAVLAVTPIAAVHVTRLRGKSEANAFDVIRQRSILDLFVKVAALIDAGELTHARRIFYKLRPAIDALFAEPNPGALKAAAAVTKQVRALSDLMFD